MFTPIQIILIFVATHLMATLTSNTQMIIKFGGQQVTRCLVIGIIMGDVPTALLIGGTMQLMSMGLAGYGGASIPNYNTAAIIGTAYAIASGTDAPLELALAIGIPVATLALQLDIIAKTVNSFWYHLTEKFVAKRNYKAAYRTILIGEYGFGRMALQQSYPVLIFLLFGEPIVNAIVTYMPAWLTTALNVMAGVLPALGMAILMIYMPVKEYFWMMALGFILYQYVGLAILPITIIGAIIAYLLYQSMEKERIAAENAQTTTAGGIGDE